MNDDAVFAPERCANRNGRCTHRATIAVSVKALMPMPNVVGGFTELKLCTCCFEKGLQMFEYITAALELHRNTAAALDHMAEQIERHTHPKERDH